MKNIHLIPTDKPSRLYSFYGILEDLTYGKTFTIVNEKVAKINLHKDLKDYQEKLIKANWKGENIYITSDERIKEGNWYISILENEVYKATKKTQNIMNVANLVESTSYKKTHFKIILTTDQDLIKDGVQAIDDEFLEWFVKNPSCEEVETIHGLFNPMGRQVDPMNLGQNHSQCVWKYKIIIPQEEPTPVWKQIIESCGGEEEFMESAGLKPKKETLKEAAENYTKDGTKHYMEKTNVELGFINGAKWQQERSYSEDKVIILLNKFGGKVYGDYTRNQTMEDFTEEWFEQYKKK
jgi:hypothetical protein